MNELETLTTYLATSPEAMRALDRMRREAEGNSVTARTWRQLAAAYLSQGRPCQAAACQRRAQHYASA